MARERTPGLARAAATLFGLALFTLVAPAALASAPVPVGPDPVEHGATHYPNPNLFNWINFDYQDKDIYGGEVETGDEPAMSPPFVLMLMNFAVVLIIIGWKVTPAVNKYVVDRHETIKEALEEASRLRDEAQARLAEYDEKLAAAEAEVDQLIADIRAGAEEEKKRIVADAEAQARAMKRDAEARIAAELSRARSDIERQVVAAAIAAAETLIRDNATGADRTRLIDSFIGDLQKQAEGHDQERV